MNVRMRLIELSQYLYPGLNVRYVVATAGVTSSKYLRGSDRDKKTLTYTNN